jgi:hypothetical protein
LFHQLVEVHRYLATRQGLRGSHISSHHTRVRTPFTRGLAYRQ